MDDIEPMGSPTPPWFMAKLEQLRFQALDSTPFVVLCAHTSREHLAEWLDAHLPGDLDLGDEVRMRIKRRKTQEENAYPDLVLGGYAILLSESGRWAATFKPGFFHPILLFRAAPCSPDRCEITLFRTPDPRVRPLIDSLLRDISRAWPETAETLAPLIPGAATGSSQPDPARIPRVPSKPGTLARWRKVWEIIQSNGLDWKTSEAISRDVRLKNLGLAYSVETIEDILAAGRAGELD